MANNYLSKRKEELKITVKLLSSKGLSFTIGTIEINQQIILKNANRIDLKVTQTQDIEARCIFEYHRAEHEFNTPKK